MAFFFFFFFHSLLSADSRMRKKGKKRQCHAETECRTGYNVCRLGNSMTSDYMLNFYSLNFLSTCQIFICQFSFLGKVSMFHFMYFSCTS